MNIYVGNLSYDVSDEELGEAFSAFGTVTSRLPSVADRNAYPPESPTTGSDAGVLVRRGESARVR